MTLPILLKTIKFPNSLDYGDLFLLNRLTKNIMNRHKISIKNKNTILHFKLNTCKRNTCTKRQNDIVHHEISAYYTYMLNKRDL